MHAVMVRHHRLTLRPRDITLIALSSRHSRQLHGNEDLPRQMDEILRYLGHPYSKRVKLPRSWL